MTDLEKPGCELALAQHLRALADGDQCAREPRDDGDADGQRGHEHHLDDDEPEHVLLEQPPGQRGQHGVHGNQVDDEAASQIHTWIPYFSNRR